MAVPVHTKDIGAQVCQALGLEPDKIKNLTLRLRADEVVTMTVEYVAYVTGEQMDKLTTVLKHYRLMNINNDMVLHPGDGDVY
jgi:hypothetical protein